MSALALMAGNSLQISPPISSPKREKSNVSSSLVWTSWIVSCNKISNMLR